MEKLARITGRRTRSSGSHVPFACISALYSPILDSKFIQRPSILPPAGARAATMSPLYTKKPLVTGSMNCFKSDVAPLRTTFRASMNAPRACASSVEALDRARGRIQNRFRRLKGRRERSDSSHTGPCGVQIGAPKRSTYPDSMLVGPIWTTSGRRRPGSAGGTGPAVPQGDNVGALYPFPELHAGRVALL